MILFRQKYPRWWFDWNLELVRFSNRIGVYLALMDDRYPSTDDHQAVTLDLSLPGCQAGPKPLAATRQVAARDPSLHPARFPPGSQPSSRWSSPGSRSSSPGTTHAASSTSCSACSVGTNRVVGYAFTLVTDHMPFRLNP